MRLEDSLVHSNIEAIVALDAQFQICLFNPAAEAVFGYPAAEVLGHSLESIVRVGALDQLRQRIQTGAADLESRGQGSLSVEVIGRHKDGSEVPLEAIVSVVRADDGQPQYVAFMRDVTARKQT